MGNKIDGTLIGQNTRQQIKQDVQKIVDSGNRAPHLVVFMVGDDPRSLKYVNGKGKACQETNISYTLEKLPADIEQTVLIDKINQYNNDDGIDGIIVQLPLPKHLDEKTVTETVIPEKDVDGLTQGNLIKLYNNEECLAPATPLGIMKLLEDINVDVAGKHVVIVGRGKLVGKPIYLLMLNKNATVTLCHSHTANLTEITQSADILVVAIGQKKFINSSHIKPGAVVIDAGINVDEDGKLYGDCDYLEMLDKASWITPVPKGVGPMTITMLLSNVVKAYHSRGK